MAISIQYKTQAKLHNLAGGKVFVLNGNAFMKLKDNTSQMWKQAYAADKGTTPLSGRITEFTACAVLHKDAGQMNGGEIEFIHNDALVHVVDTMELKVG